MLNFRRVSSHMITDDISLITTYPHTTPHHISLHITYIHRSYHIVTYPQHLLDAIPFQILISKEFNLRGRITNKRTSKPNQNKS